MIENDVPLPSTRGTKYEFEYLTDVGQSFTVNATLNAARSAATKVGKKLGKKFFCQKIKGNKIRCWYEKPRDVFINI